MIAFEAVAGVRRRAFSEGFAGDLAKRLADVLHRLISADPVTLVAGAHCRTRAGAVHASFLADRLADVARVTQETVALLAQTGLRHEALAHHAWFAANRFADKVLFLSVACIAGAGVGRRAFAEQAIPVTLWITKVIDVPVTLETFVTNANARRRALAVYAAGTADWQACIAFWRWRVILVAGADVGLNAIRVQRLAVVASWFAGESIHPQVVTLIAFAHVGLDALAVHAILADRIADMIAAVRFRVQV